MPARTKNITPTLINKAYVELPKEWAILIDEMYVALMGTQIHLAIMTEVVIPGVGGALHPDDQKWVVDSKERLNKNKLLLEEFDKRASR